MTKRQLQQASGNGQRRGGMSFRVAELLDTYVVQISLFPYMMLIPSSFAAAYMSFMTPEGSEPSLRDPLMCLSLLIAAVQLLSFPCSVVLVVLNAVLHCLG